VPRHPIPHAAEKAIDLDQCAPRCWPKMHPLGGIFFAATTAAVIGHPNLDLAASQRGATSPFVSLAGTVAEQISAEPYAFL
jgi:hypothetical protein